MRHQPDDSIGTAQSKKDGDEAPKHVAAKIQMSDLPDHHVLGIANKRRRSADIAGDSESDQKGDGIEPFSQQGRADYRSENKADDVVIEESGETSRHDH